MSPCYRDSKGRYSSVDFFRQELQARKVPMKYADGRRIRMTRQDFIRRFSQKMYSEREIKRQKRKYQRQKRKKTTGRKIIPELIAPPVVETVGRRGKVRKEEPKFTGGGKTYIRWGWKLRQRNGSYLDTGSNAGVFFGNISLKDALERTEFYNTFNRIRPDLASGDYYLDPESGIHYYRFREDSNGYRHVIPGSEKRIIGKDVEDA